MTQEERKLYVGKTSEVKTGALLGGFVDSRVIDKERKEWAEHLAAAAMENRKILVQIGDAEPQEYAVQMIVGPSSGERSFSLHLPTDAPHVETE